MKIYLTLILSLCFSLNSFSNESMSVPNSNCTYSLSPDADSASVRYESKTWQCETVNQEDSLFNLKCNRDFNFSKTLTVDIVKNIGFFNYDKCVSDRPFGM